MKRTISLWFVIGIMVSFCIPMNQFSNSSKTKDMFFAETTGIQQEFEQSLVTDDWVDRPMGDKGIWIIDLFTYGNAIVLDGNLSDWAGIPHDVFNGVDVYLAYNETYVFVATSWVDPSNDGEISCWNKTGHINSTHGIWEELDGADDILSIGFSNGTYTDRWIWTNSLKGDANFAYETDGIYTADSGALPFIRNENPLVADQPGFDNTSVVITDHTSILNGTRYFQWFDNTPDGSQTDVSIAQSWNASGDGKYIVEFLRPLDTGSYIDDIKLDFLDLTDQTFFVGSENKHDALDSDVSVYELALAADNEPADFEIDTIVNDVVGPLLITGHCYDDYYGTDILIHLSGWNDTYGPGYIANAKFGINHFTGGWSYLLYYDENDMPIGDHVLSVEFKPKYDESIKVIQNITIDDINPPQIVGLVDLNERYQNGVPIAFEYVPVTVGINDNYDPNDYLIVHLYSWKGDDVAWMTPMQQFAPGSTTFHANITLDYSPSEDNNYTYFVQVFDTSNNKALSEWYWFYLGEIPAETTITLTAPTTSIGLGITFISGLIVGTIALSIVFYISFKKFQRHK